MQTLPVRTRVAVTIFVSLIAVVALPYSVALGGEPNRDPGRQVLYLPKPAVMAVAQLSGGIDSATISDVEVVDLDGDGRNDIVVAWYATDYHLMSANVRALTVFFNEGGTFSRAPDIDLYVPNYGNPSLSVFRNGTADVGLGDFDGDGDVDLAVSAFFGDELWFIENLGNRQFAKHLKFPFDFNSPTNFLTPPEMLAADFDGDGRDELVYVADPIQYVDGEIIHVWKTWGGIADMCRLDWQPGAGSVTTQWTRALAIADFDGDGRPDLCFTGTIHPPNEDGPIVTVWYGLDAASGRFAVRNEYPTILCSDVVDVRPTPGCRPGFILTDLGGAKIQYWERSSSGMSFVQRQEVTGYAGLSPNRGMTAVVADVDGDGDLDLVTKQKLGGPLDRNQVEITLWDAGGAVWTRVDPTPLDSRGFQNVSNNQILRPRNLAVADLVGNSLPEIVAGFGPSILPQRDGGGDTQNTLAIAMWVNSCLGDVNRDGKTDAADVALLCSALGTSSADPGFNPDADLDKDGHVSRSDLTRLLGDFGCRCSECGDVRLGDSNCDGRITSLDVDGFTLALAGRAQYLVVYPDCNWLNADCNGDGVVDWRDIDTFVALLTNLLPPTQSLSVGALLAALRDGQLSLTSGE